MATYYNEFDKRAAAWLRELIKDGQIPAGDVDERSITDVDPAELTGYRQLHFFAGIGGWAIAARLAGWPDDKELVTGSCPCQPFSIAGKGAGIADARHLWPDFFRIIRALRPAAVFGEQVAAAVGKNWFARVRADMESIGYAGRGIVVPACAIGAPHRRDRLWFAYGRSIVGHGHGHGQGLEERERIAGIRRIEGGASTGQDAAYASAVDGGALEHTESIGRGEGRAESVIRSGRPAVAGASLPCGDVADSDSGGRGAGDDHAPAGYGHPVAAARGAGAWDGARWLICHDGKARRVEPSIPLLVTGLQHRAPLLRGYGNSILPQIGAEMMAAWMEEFPE